MNPDPVPTPNPLVLQARDASNRLGEYLGAAYAEAVTMQRPDVVAKLVSDAMVRHSDVQTLLVALAMECVVETAERDEPDNGVEL